MDRQDSKHGRAGDIGPVLVVEDNEANRILALRQLEKLGYQATAVESGREALDAIAKNRYGAVLMDCQMPGMNGLEAARAIRARETRQGGHVPILAMTANATARDREECRAAGMDDFIAKPVLIESLSTALSRWLPDASEPETEAPPSMEDSSARVEPPYADLDAVRFERLREELGDAAFSGFLRTYLAELPARAHAIREAILARDTEALRLTAHTLKSTSSAVGSLALAGICADLEAAGRAGAVDGAEDRLVAFQAACEATIEWLSRQPGWSEG